ncbi:30S ribosomal protein S16 [Chlamydiifrater phoenicopteri]|uniref:30S ribosomal protein S16 n=1 Tax=Chlamydiifrater phoenicopteri TaxID=2681469 RepID=UPI001BD0C196|nr:30S ribosomal protein S16 [Chlamydiifrater phoenicopteri]
MALKIRLRQQGRRNGVVYRLVLTETSSPRDGKYVEMLGWYDPRGQVNYKLHGERIFYWLSQGAELTEKASVLVKRGAPGVYQEYLTKKLERRAVLCKKRRAYRKRLSEKRDNRIKEPASK